MLVLLAISLLAGVMFVGGATIGPALAGDDGGDGVFPVLDILSGDGGGGTELSLAANRTELTAGDPVTFTVTDSNGSAVSDATVTVDGTRRAVDEEGRVVVRIERAGSVTATATAPGANETTLLSNGVDLSVAHRRVRLDIEANRSVTTAGEPIALTLVRADSGDPIEGSIAAALAPEGAPVPSQFETADGEQLVLVPDRAGTLHVDGARATDGDETFETAAVTLDVERRTVALNLSVTPTDVVAGEVVNATVRRADTGDPIDATLAVDGQSIQTGPDGHAEIELESAGNRTIEATAVSTQAATFTPDSASVTVERQQVGLQASVDRSAITTGGSVTVTVVRNDTGDPVDATVTIGDQEFAAGSDGTVETTVAEPGEHRILVTAPNTPSTTFLPAEQQLGVSNATFDLGSLEAPATAEPGASVSVSTTVTNLGPQDGTDTLALSIGGERVATEAVSLAAGAESTVTLDATAPAEAGSYEVAIRGSDGAATGTIAVES